MPRKVRQIKADLRTLGFHNRGGDGSHTNWIHPLLPGTRITVAGKDSEDCRHYNENDLRKARQALAALKERGGR
jgi:predicted RNA binding protein YcfA (HicA-like mRNA interferase family)